MLDLAWTCKMWHNAVLAGGCHTSATLPEHFTIGETTAAP